MKYEEFLRSKRIAAPSFGFPIDDPAVNQKLFRWQRDIVRWSLRKGRAALFEDCGLGKTPQQLEWAAQVANHTDGMVLLLLPLAVGPQTLREHAKFNIDCECRIVACQGECRPGINITNYEKLDHFWPDRFAGVVLDESSILKSYTGKTKRKLLDYFAKTPYRLACTATPAPNDLMELGNHAEFLGIMPSNEMLARWFINDGKSVGKYRLRRHARKDFWRWVASWAVCVSKPSDLGHSDEGYNLPPLIVHEHTIESQPQPGFLFAAGNISATQVHQEKRSSLEERAAAVAKLVNGDNDQWAIWCDTDYEADILKKKIPDAVEVRGSHSESFKELSCLWFSGHICDCQLNPKLFRNKLAACGNSNTQHRDANDITQIPTSDRGDVAKGDPQTKTSATCDLTTSPTKIDSGNTKSPTSKSVTGEGESDTQPIRVIGRSASNRPGGETAPNDETLDCNPNSVSESNSTTPYSKPRTADAPSAKQNSQMAENVDCTSTIATSRKRSADSSAGAAISASENSKTTQSLSVQPCDICGGVKPRRILISKPGIFGLGVNWQHCHKTTWFAGYSYEKFYQSIRRLLRFGQKHPVELHVVLSEVEQSIADAVRRKQAEHDTMKSEMAEAMKEFQLENLYGDAGCELAQYRPTVEVEVPEWIQSKA